MYRGYKIIANTAAGRRRYMQYLVPFVIASDVIDRYDIWINTHNGADIEFFKQLAEKFQKINLVWQPDGVVNGISSINAFYKDCIDEDAIYFKLDDDIPWMEPDAIRKMVDFRIDNPDYFLVSPLVINNAASTYLLQLEDKIKFDKYYNSVCVHPVFSLNGEFCAQLHEWFLDNYLIPGKWESLYVGKHPIALARFSINAILWFGRDLKKIDGIIPGDDEEFLSCIYPACLGKANCYNGDAIIAHFAFYTQREILDKKDILSRYGKYLADIWSTDSQMKPIHETVQSIINYIEGNLEDLSSRPSPYKAVPPKKEIKPTYKTRMALRLAHHLPTVYALFKRKDKGEENRKYIFL